MSLVESLYEKNTRAFISFNASDLTVIRRIKVATPDGGYRLEIVDPLPAQTGRIIYSNNRGDSQSRETPDGRTVILSATAMFMPGADIQEDDFLTDGDRLWEVGNVSRVPTWRVTARLSLNG